MTWDRGEEAGGEEGIKVSRRPRIRAAPAASQGGSVAVDTWAVEYAGVIYTPISLTRVWLLSRTRLQI